PAVHSNQPDRAFPQQPDSKISALRPSEPPLAPLPCCNLPLANADGKSSRSTSPRRPRIVPSAQGRWGWVNDLGGNYSDMSEKIIAESPIPPRDTSGVETTQFADRVAAFVKAARFGWISLKPVTSGSRPPDLK